MKPTTKSQTRKLSRGTEVSDAQGFANQKTDGKTIAIIQARLGSSRLPGKILLDIAGQSMLQRVVARVEQAKLIDQVVIATTTQETDEPLVQYCEDRNWDYYRGSEQDVLTRYLEAAHQFSADRIVRITSDCPLIDPEVVDQLVQLATSSNESEFEYSCNFYPDRRYPRGLDCECISAEALERIGRLATTGEYREHVTLYAYRNPNQFSIGSLSCPGNYSNLRWTVDTPQDLQLVRMIYQHFESAGEHEFNWQQAVAACQENPQWQALNQLVVQKAA